MLRVGLTGGLGSGKSTVAAMLRELGAQVIEADALGRTLMEPGQAVYAADRRALRSRSRRPDGRLNRARLADLAFRHGRLQELNAIVHPPVIEAQARWMDEVFAPRSAAVAVIESALIFEVVRDARARGENDSILADWRRRIDRIIVVTAPDELKIARYAARIQAANGGGGSALKQSRPMRGIASRTRFPTPKKPRRPIMCLIIRAIWKRCAPRSQALWPRLRDESNKSGQ